MSRTVLPLLFVLFFMGGDAADARHGGLFCRHRTHGCCYSPCEKAGEPVKTVETIKGTKSVEHYCIKDICMQFPNPPHLYYCLYYPDACDDFSECLEEFWYGYLPANEMPQHCPDCEVYQGWGTGRGRPPEGHGRTFTKKQQVINWVHDKIPGATTNDTDYNYYEIPLEPNKKVYAVVTKVELPHAGLRYIGVETKKLEDQTPANGDFIKVKERNPKKSVIYIECDVASEPTRLGLIWRKDNH
jgi:hypothetical protein